MEEEDDNNSKNSSSSSSINDLPPELIRVILLRLPTKDLARLRCVSKVWLSLISDPNFLKSHLQLSNAPTHSCLLLERSEARSADLDALLSGDDEGDGGGHAAPVKISFPFKEKPPSYRCLGSCRGFVVLYEHPHFLIIWNPLTGSHKRIPCDHFVRRFLFGFGYDSSRDDYLVALARRDPNNKEEDHFDLFSLRTNSWKSFEVALPNALRTSSREWGLFFNGAIHWLVYTPDNDDSDDDDDDDDDDKAIIVFDLNERSFSQIPLPKQMVLIDASLRVLGGCLALYSPNHDQHY